MLPLNRKKWFITLIAGREFRTKVKINFKSTIEINGAKP